VLRLLVRAAPIGLLIFILIVSGTPASAIAPAAQVAPPEPLAGRQAYLQNCAPCHGQTGKGDGPSAAGLGAPPTALGDYQRAASQPLAEWFNVTKNGRMARMMPPWGGRLSDKEMWDAVAFAWTLHTSAGEVSMGKALYEQSCATCHGPEGKGKPPMLDLTNFAATSAISQDAWGEVLARGRNTMPAFGDKLSAFEQRAVLEYVRSLSLGPLFRGPLPGGAGVISGTITNATTGQPAANLTVNLGIFDAASLLEERQATTDGAGFFRFGDLPTDATLIYAAQVEYPAGIPLGSGVLQFEAGQTTINLPMFVYETTGDSSGIRAERVHFIIEFDAGQLLVAELMVFGLSGDRTYVGDANGVLRFTLPAGAEGLEISGEELGGRYQLAADGFVDLLPLPPGKGVRQILFSYRLPYAGSTLDLARTIPYPADNVNALVTDVGAQVTSQQLVNQGLRQTQGGSFINLVGQNVPANQPITLRFANAPSTAAGGSGSRLAPAGADRGLLLILVGAMGLVVALLVAWPMWRRRAAAGPTVPPPADREGLIDALARLELAFEDGQLSESAYGEQRLRLKARLMDVVQKERQP
jgi:mono/diheme cytochrome c family protein